MAYAQKPPNVLYLYIPIKMYYPSKSTKVTKGLNCKCKNYKVIILQSYKCKDFKNFETQSFLMLTLQIGCH